MSGRSYEDEFTKLELHQREVVAAEANSVLLEEIAAHLANLGNVQIRIAVALEKLIPAEPAQAWPPYDN